MNILLIESSSKIIEFAYYKNGDFAILKKLKDDQNADDLVYEIRKAFDENGFKLSEIQYVALSNGPGSFTGLRISSAIAKGICFAVNSKLIEIVTLDIIAEKAGVFGGEKIIVPLIFSNSKNGEFYFCEYKLSDGKIERISDYSVVKSDEMNKNKRLFVINEKTDFPFSDDIMLMDLSEKSNMKPMLKISKEYINQGMFSDFYESEPFYMKKFLGH